MSEGFNALEQAILEWFKRVHNNPGLSAQIDSAKLKSREYTGIGFFVDFDVSRELRPVDLRAFGGSPIDGPIIHSPDISIGALTELFVSDGYIDELEIIAIGDHFAEQLDTFELTSP